MNTTLDRRTIGRWLAVWAASLFVLILVGGGTRLTESGLSITEWKPVSGVVPPLTDAAWQAEFGKYKEIPQYKQLNAGMSLAQFKAIFWWEFLHRLWARFVGLVFVLPLAWLWLRRRIPRAIVPRLAALGVLMGLQGAMGWYMVASGLTARVNVSQYRLAAHLSLALVIYLLAVWTADRLLRAGRDDGGGADSGATAQDGTRATDRGNAIRGTRRQRHLLGTLLALAFITVVSGAFVAGLRAGHIYNEFPMMGVGLVPIEYGMMHPWWRDFFENPATAQFNHRVLAIVVLFATIAGYFRARMGAGKALKSRLNLVLAAIVIQVSLGITTLLLSVPVTMGVAHQAGALFVLTALTLSLSEAAR